MKIGYSLAIDSENAAQELTKPLDTNVSDWLIGNIQRTVRYALCILYHFS